MRNACQRTTTLQRDPGMDIQIYEPVIKRYSFKCEASYSSLYMSPFPLGGTFIVFCMIYVQYFTRLGGDQWAHFMKVKNISCVIIFHLSYSLLVIEVECLIRPLKCTWRLLFLINSLKTSVALTAISYSTYMYTSWPYIIIFLVKSQHFNSILALYLQAWFVRFTWHPPCAIKLVTV